MVCLICRRVAWAWAYCTGVEQDRAAAARSRHLDHPSCSSPLAAGDRLSSSHHYKNDNSSYTNVAPCGAISGWTGLGWISGIEHITMLIMTVSIWSVCLDDFKAVVVSTNRISQPIPR